jgi:hypothetical protein
MAEYLRPLDEAGQLRFLLDSGAFTAWKSANPIKIDDYCRFLEQLPIMPWRYFALDVIGDPHGTMRNYELMLKRGFKPIPIFTRGENPDVLDEYFKTSDVVGIGGLVGTPRNKGFVKGLSKFINGRRVHLLGFTNKSFLKVLKPYSCDSSSIQSAARYGQVELFDIKKGTWIKLQKSIFSSKPPSAVIQLIESYDVAPIDLARNDNWVGLRSIGRRLSFRSHVRASLAYERILGVKYFLALNAVDQIVLILDCYGRESFLYDRMHKANPVLRRASGS